MTCFHAEALEQLVFFRASRGRVNFRARALRHLHCCKTYTSGSGMNQDLLARRQTRQMNERINERSEKHLESSLPR